ncbi:MAG: DUF1616 domain-containing protein [Thermoplasmatota archaeon]
MARRLDHFPFHVVAVAAAWGLWLALVLIEDGLGVDTGPVRTAVALAVLLVTPGYAFVYALYPERRLPDEESARLHQERLDRRRDDEPLSLIAYRERREKASLTGFHRTAVSLGASAAIIGLAGILVEKTGPGVTWTTTTLALGAWTATWLVLGTLRWLRLPAADRHTLQVPELAGGLSGARLLSGAAFLLLLLATALVLVEAITGDEKEPSTTLFVLGELGDGRCYPTYWVDDRYLPSLSATEQECPDPSQNLTVALVNREGRTQDYTLRTVWVQGYDRLNRTAPTAVVVDQTWTAQVEAEEEVPRGTATQAGYSRSFTAPPPPGEGAWRYFVQVYKGTDEPPAPAETVAFVESPYRHTHLPILVGLPE